MKVITIFFCLFIAFSVYSQVMVEFDPFTHRLLNQEAPAFASKALNNEDISLKELRGKVILLDFWSLSCGACFKQLPELNELVVKYSNDNFILISIMEDTREMILEKFEITDNGYRLKKKLYGNDKIAFQVIPNGREIIRKYSDNYVYPRSFIIDVNGDIVFHMEGYAESRGVPNELTTHDMLIRELNKLLKVKP